MGKLVNLILVDIAKSKVIILYTVVLSLLAWSVFSLEDSPSKGLLTIINVLLLVTPMMTLLFTSIYLYNSFEFIELLLSQPVARKGVWVSFYLAMVISFVMSFLLACLPTLLVYLSMKVALLTAFLGVLITMVFVSIAFYIVTLSRDKSRGIGWVILVWLYFAILFDGILLFLSFQLSEYPIEKIMVFVAATNPIDLARISLLMQLDSAAMLGYSGALFKQVFGAGYGLALALLLLLGWACFPFVFSLFRFKKMDM